MRPLIWRGLRVRSDVTMGGSHEILQAARGWFDCPLHEFRIGERATGITETAEWGKETPPDDEQRVTMGILDGGSKRCTAPAKEAPHWGDGLKKYRGTRRSARSAVTVLYSRAFSEIAD
jgi:hypothetical protein